MSPTTSELNARWAGLIVDEWVRTGVTFVCMASGSRCSPLTIAAARHPGIDRVQHVDERGLGFVAVGYARATGRAAAVITTSGTAVANLLPAVCEADASRLPMLILSADRPPELRRTQANQTMHQPGIFGERVRWFDDLPCPTDEIPDAYLRTTIDQAVYRTRRSPAGPVHLNLMFREPLLGKEDSSFPVAGAAPPYTLYSHPGNARIESPPELASIQRGLLVVGELAGEADRHAACRIAEILQWPVLADVTSGLQFGGVPDSLGIPHYDLLLPRPSLTSRIDGVVHLGGRMVSKRLAQALASSRPATWIQVADHPDRHDPDHGVRHHIDAGLSSFAAGVLRPTAASPSWLEEWQCLGRGVVEALDEQLPHKLCEPWVAREVVRALPSGHGLCLGNSMPVRDVLSFAPSVGRVIPVCVNRGVSGIDGTVSTASGFAAGRGAPATVLIGDLSLLHDLNALGLLRSAAEPLTLVVLNNNGGGIFHFLPVAKAEDVFEPWFATPHGLEFEQAAALYGLAYHAPSTPQAFGMAYAEATASGRSSLIEVRSDRQENVNLHRMLMDRLR